MTVLEDWEHGNEPENASYGGETGSCNNQQTAVYEGSYALSIDAPKYSYALIADTDQTVSQGDTLQAWVRLNNAGDFGNAGCGIVYAAQSEAGEGSNSGYAVLIGGNDMYRIDGGSKNTLINTSYNYSLSTWYQIKIIWDTDGTHTIEVFDTGGTKVNSASTTDATYTTGGIGFICFTGSGNIDEYEKNPSSGSPPSDPSNLSLTIQ